MLDSRLGFRYIELNHTFLFMKTHIPAYLAALVSLAGTAFALPMAESLEAAKPIAKAENRTILLDLTGKDWCPGCIYLKNKILDSEVMDKAMGSKYVVVEIDYPRAPEKIAAIAEEERNARMDILKTYKVGGLPCVIYMDAEGLPFAVYTEYTQTPEQYMEKIMAKAEAVRVERDAAFARAATLEGMEKARALAAGLDCLPEVCRGQYKEVLGVIAALDPENTLGYSNIISDANRRLEQLKAWDKKIESHFAGQKGSRMAPENLDATIKMCEEYLGQEGLIPEVRQQVLSIIVDAHSFKRDIPMIYASAHRAMNEMPGTELAEKYQELIQYYDADLLDRTGTREAALKAAEPYMKK